MVSLKSLLRNIVSLPCFVLFMYFHLKVKDFWSSYVGSFGIYVDQLDGMLKLYPGNCRERLGTFGTGTLRTYPEERLNSIMAILIFCGMGSILPSLGRSSLPILWTVTPLLLEIVKSSTCLPLANEWACNLSFGQSDTLFVELRVLENVFKVDSSP